MKMNQFKAACVAVFGVVFNFLGILAIPAFLLVGCNFIDYITGVVATKYRNEQLTSYKGIRGIFKKIGMWVLIFIGWALDMLINYATQYVGLSIQLPFIVATVVTVWLICNEFISILENLIDIGVEIPPFLMPLAKMIKSQVEDKTKME